MKNIENTKIDYLNIGKFVGKTRSGKRLWECRCECGNEFIVDEKILSRRMDCNSGGNDEGTEREREERINKVEIVRGFGLFM